MNATELLQAIARHFDGGGTSLNHTSPLIIAAREVLAATPADALRPLLKPRVGLSKDDLERRRKTLGSSEVAAILGVNPFQSDHDVWMSKVMGVDFEGNEATHLGNLAEPLIFGIYSDRYDKTLIKGEYTLGPEPWMSCTPDAVIVGEDGLVEAKLVGLRSIFMWGAGNDNDSESDAVPMHYLVQALWQLIVTGRAFVHVSALLGTEFRSYTVRRNPDVEAMMVERCRDWWQRYVRGATPPPVDGTAGASAMLKRLYPRSGGEPITATPELEALAAKLIAARATYDAALLEKTRCENAMKAALGEASGAHGEGWRARYSTTKDGRRPLVFDSDRDTDEVRRQVA